MFIIWSGQGILVVVTAIIGFLISFLILKLFGIDIKDQLGDIIVYLSYIVSFIGLGFYGKKVNAFKETGLINEETGERVYTKNKHTFYWIPLQYWGIIGSMFFLMLLLLKLS